MLIFKKKCWSPLKMSRFTLMLIIKMLRNYILKCWAKKVEVHWKYRVLIKNVGKYYVELKCWWSLKCWVSIKEVGLKCWVSQNCWSSLKMLDIFLTKCWPVEKKRLRFPKNVEFQKNVDIPIKCWIVWIKMLGKNILNVEVQ